MKCTLFTKRPNDFFPAVEASGCYCEYEDKILLLKRHPYSQQGGTWNVPGGKFESGEDSRRAVVREIREEVGLDIDDKKLEQIGMLYARLPHIDYVYHMFRKHFTTKPCIDLNLNEHIEARWVTISEALTLPLIAGGSEAFTYYLNQCNEL